jgi:hypothetical protein
LRAISGFFADSFWMIWKKSIEKEVERSTYFTGLESRKHYEIQSTIIAAGLIFSLG